jgi:hypothetical protein
MTKFGVDGHRCRQSLPQLRWGGQEGSLQEIVDEIPVTTPGVHSDEQAQPRTSTRSATVSPTTETEWALQSSCSTLAILVKRSMTRGGGGPECRLPPALGSRIDLDAHASRLFTFEDSDGGACSNSLSPQPPPHPTEEGLRGENCHGRHLRRDLLLPNHGSRAPSHHTPRRKRRLRGKSYPRRRWQCDLSFPNHGSRLRLQNPIVLQLPANPTSQVQASQGAMASTQH